MDHMRAVKGFTMIELMVSISIIAIMSAAALSAFQGAREQTRDTVRAQNLATIAKALIAHNLEFGNWVEDGYGEWDGNGFMGVAGSGGEPSTIDRLVTTNLLPEEIIDPLGSQGAGVGTGHPGYMKYHCPLSPAVPTQIYLYARMESKPITDNDTDGTCCPDCDTNYGMNYYQLISAN